MLLSVKPPLPNGIKSSHDYSHLAAPHQSRYSPPDSPPRGHAHSIYDKPDMNMSNQHRGLPPPMGMTLPPPDRGLPAMAGAGLPAPPSGWTGNDESMRVWLQARAEEERRKAEEERTRQERLRLDQRAIEQAMLRESLQGGIPAPMVPLIFAGMGGAALTTQSLEWAQQYMHQLSIQNQQPPPPPLPPAHHQPQLHAAPQHHQHQQPMSPDLGRDSRMIPANPYASQHQQLQPALTSSALSSQLQSQPQSSLNRTSLIPPPMPRSTSSALSRIQTGEPLPAPTSQPGGLHQLQQAQPPSGELQSNTAPGLFFHHWTPTSANTKGPQPPTPSGKDTKASPFSQTQQSHLRADYVNSPKKRKAAGGQPLPAGMAGPSDSSPPFSSRSSRERDPSPRSRNEGRRHSRQRSDASSEGRVLARPSSRQQRQDAISGASPDGPKRQETNSSVSTSGDEGSTRYQTGQPETYHSPHSAGHESKEILGTKRELET